MVIAPGVVRASAVTRHRIVSGWLLQVVSVQIHSFKQNPKKKKKRAWNPVVALFSRCNNGARLPASFDGRFTRLSRTREREPKGTGGRGSGREARQTFNTKLDVLVICGRSCVASVRPGQLKPAVDRTCNVTLIWRNKKTKQN